jgi:hypothetical protein
VNEIHFPGLDFCVIQSLKKKKMKTQESKKTWGPESLSFWLTLVIALGIIFIGARFMLNPNIGARGYGISITNIHDLSYGRIKGIRDIFSGLVLLPVLFFKMRKAAAIILSSAIIIPATDFSMVWMANGAGDLQHLLIHGLTTVYMIITSILLFQENK